MSTKPGRWVALGLVMAAAGAAVFIARRAHAPEPPVVVPEPPSPVPARTPAPRAEPVEWSTKGIVYRNRLGQDVRVACPPRGTPASVWGSDVYSDDSSICTAALHAGLVGLAEGGVVTLRIEPGREAYSSTVRNDLTTSAYGPWGGSFSFPSGDSGQP